MTYTQRGVSVYQNGKLIANAVTPELARQLVQQLNGPDDYLKRVADSMARLREATSYQSVAKSLTNLKVF